MAYGIDSHPQKQHIIDSILAGKALRAIAATLDPPLHFTVIQRYKNKVVRPALSSAAALTKVLGKGAIESEPSQELARQTQALTSQALQSDHLLSRVQQHRATVDAQILRADPKGCAALISADLRGVELEAKLTGRLDAQPNQTNIMIVCPAGAPEPAVTLDRDAVVIDIGPKR